MVPFKRLGIFANGSLPFISTGFSTTVPPPLFLPVVPPEPVVLLPLWVLSPVLTVSSSKSFISTADASEASAPVSDAVSFLPQPAKPITVVKQSNSANVLIDFFILFTSVFVLVF